MSTIQPPREQVLGQPSGKKRVVWMNLMADLDTPLSALHKLSQGSESSFLLESITGGENIARYSFIGVHPKKIITGMPGDAEDHLIQVQQAAKELEFEPVEGLPAFVGGALLMLSYDYVRRIEALPANNPDPLETPDVLALVMDEVVVFDHAKNQVRAFQIIEADEASYAAAERRFEEIKGLLAGPLPALPTSSEQAPRFLPPNLSRSEFMDKVDAIKNYIRAGDCIQVVPSVRHCIENPPDSLQLYRQLRTLNPSPFMFLIRTEWGDLIGASPELLVGLHGDEARVRPIAGTRKRGESEKLDQAIAEELLADEKERAEHVMLVDLGRNDLGRIAEPGTVEVRDFMVIERYSHVMHIVSDVRAKVKPSQSCVDVIRAAFPAGTLSGAPKVRAMEIIDEMETVRRGFYGGAVGYLAPNGDFDLAIAIRSIVKRGDSAHIQAGAGIVFDSQPEAEWEEVINKSSAMLRAVENA